MAPKKAGRNEPCPCGSGRKHKHCCLANEPKQGTGPAAAATVDLAQAVQQGLQFHQAGRLSEAETIYRQVLQLRPDEPDALHLLGMVAHQTGHFDAAIELIARAVAVKPDYAVAHNNLGNSLKERGHLDAAAGSYRAAIAVDPRFAEAHLNLGLVLNMQGRVDDAAASCRQALSLKPDMPEAHFSLALAMQEQGRYREAIDGYARAIALRPHYAQAHNNLGSALWNSGRPHDAVRSYRQAIGLQPGYADAHHNLGLALMDVGQPHDAVASYRQAVALNPRHFEAWGNLATALLELGRADEARQCHLRAHELGDTGALVRSALMLPPIMGTKEEMLASRAAYERDVDALMARGIKFDDPLKQSGVTSFYLAYHGMDDLGLQRKVARFYEQACPSLLFEAPHCARPRRPGKARVGFLSKFIYDHSVSRCLGRIVCDLSNREGFEVSLLSTTPANEVDFAKTYAGFTGQRVHLPPGLQQARELVAALELDFLLYMDIGMEPYSYFLAFSRLARVQCVMGGHPVTTGIANMDLFLSAAPMEHAGSDAHYSEKLVRLPRGTYYFDRPAVPQQFKGRAELGLPERGHLYICPMKLQKIHPDFDDAVAQILQLDPQGTVVFFEDDRHSTRRMRLEARLDRTLPADVRGRVVFLPWIRDYGDFIAVNAAADVVLDSLHFGCGSTLIATFAVGTPIVTLPGDYLRGMGGTGFCRMMGVEECIATDLDDYARRAVRLATDAAFRQHVSGKILAAEAVLYNNAQPLQDMADFLASHPLQ